MATGIISRALSLAELESCDPQGPLHGDERRFWCPLPACADKPLDGSHRSLSVNITTGLWTCYRCTAGGKLPEHWTDRPTDRRGRNALAAARAFALPPETPALARPPAWREQWENLPSLADAEEGEGAAYLASRGIPLDVATAAGVRWARAFYGRPALLFPLVDPTGAVVALNGRHTDGRDMPKAHTAGPKAQGVFVTPGALAVDPFVIVEGPLDALALAACGVPALALCGTSAPSWLAMRVALHQVLLALDNDGPGNAAAAKLAREWGMLGARCSRLRPAAKDWAEDLVALGADALASHLGELVGARPASTPGRDRSTVRVLPIDVWDAGAAREITAATLRRVGWAWDAVPADQRTTELEALRAQLLGDLAPIETARQACDMLGLRQALANWERDAGPIFAAYRAARQAAEADALLAQIYQDLADAAWSPCPSCQKPVDEGGSCWDCRGRWCQGCAVAWLESPTAVECEDCRRARCVRGVFVGGV
jgi:hypothetical protein